MKTRFYKILYKGKEVVYVGVTTRTVTTRFKEHVILKSLNLANYSVVEFCSIEHPKISSLETFYEEHVRVSKLEQKFIKEELSRGSRLLNISTGGEWGAQILNKLRERDFLSKFGSYDGYEIYRRNKGKVRELLDNWVLHRSERETKKLLRNWSYNRSKSKAKKLINNWISDRTFHKVRRLLRNWVTVRTTNRTKKLLRSWIYDKSTNKTKKLVRHWISHRSESKTKQLVRNWISNRRK